MRRRACHPCRCSRPLGDAGRGDVVQNRLHRAHDRTIDHGNTSLRPRLIRLRPSDLHADALVVEFKVRHVERYQPVPLQVGNTLRLSKCRRRKATLSPEIKTNVMHSKKGGWKNDCRCCATQSSHTLNWQQWCCSLVFLIVASAMGCVPARRWLYTQGIVGHSGSRFSRTLFARAPTLEHPRLRAGLDALPQFQFCDRINDNKVRV